MTSSGQSDLGSAGDTWAFDCRTHFVPVACKLDFERWILSAERHFGFKATDGWPKTPALNQSALAKFGRLLFFSLDCLAAPKPCRSSSVRFFFFIFFFKLLFLQDHEGASPDASKNFPREISPRANGL